MSKDKKSGAVSLKVLAERKVEGVTRGISQFKVDPRLLEIEDGFNARPISPEHVAEMKLAFKNGAIFPPSLVRVEDGRVIMVDGHHRRQMFLELIDEGVEIVSVDVIHFRGNDEERVAYLLTSQQGLQLTPLQKGVQYRRLSGLGWDVKKIADKIGKTTTHVADMIKLAESNSDVHKMVESNEVAAHVALKVVRKHGEKAGAVLKKHVAENKIAGKKKVTNKTIEVADGSTPRDLVAAIEDEISSKGLFRAEKSCPKYAHLIDYLRTGLFPS